MYVSKHYTNEQIDQRLLEGYFDDFKAAGFVGTINEFWAFVLSIRDKVDKREGYDLSKNDFTDKLKEKLENIQEKANYITKVSELENDLKFQTEADVKMAISLIVDGANDALDTLKELAEALGNDPNFATTITNKLTELRNSLIQEVNRAKESETSLDTKIGSLNLHLEKELDKLNNKIGTLIGDIKTDLIIIDNMVNDNTKAIAELKTQATGNLAELKAYARDLVDKESETRKTADDKLNDDLHNLSNTQVKDKAELKADIDREANSRTNADLELDSKLTNEANSRTNADLELDSKLKVEVSDRKSEDNKLNSAIEKEVADRSNSDNLLQINIDKEAQARQSGDQVLQASIYSEATARMAADDVIGHKIDDLSDKINENKSSLEAKLIKEVEDRKEADTNIDNNKVDKREGYDLSKNDFTDKLKEKLENIQEKANYITKVSELLNDSGYQTSEDMESALQKVIGTAPEALDTLKELAEALGNDPNFATTITKRLAAITEKVNKEVEDRTKEDSKLDSKILKEVEDRKEADTNLESKLKEYTDNKVGLSNASVDALKSGLEKEIQDRKEADTNHTNSISELTKSISELALTLQESINTVKNELTLKVNNNTLGITTNTSNIQKNQEAITSLSKKQDEENKEILSKLNKEVQDRIEGDSVLANRIDTVNIGLGTEVSERKAVVQILQTNIDKEVQARKAADTDLENKLQQQFSTLSFQTDTNLNNLDGKITKEIEDRREADTNLGKRIEQLESGSSSNLTEVKELIKANTLAINQEKDRATAKEEVIQNNINTAIANQKDTINGITRDITNEANARIAGDFAIQTNLDKEVVNRKNELNLLNNKVTEQEAKLKADIDLLKNNKVDKVDNKVLSANDFTDVLYAKLQNIQEKANYITKVSELLNDSGYQTAQQVKAEIEKVIGAAPEVLNTLSEISTALGNDPNFATTITNKLEDLQSKLTEEIQNREVGDSTVESKFTNFSTTLNKTVDGLRTLLTETRSELINKTNNQDVLINKNSANIQRNLELIQGIQGNISGSYLEVKALLETEVSARQAEDVKLLGKINQNTQDLESEVQARKAADSEISTSLNEEKRIREQADTALGLRIDSETELRKQGDLGLESKIAKEVEDRKEADKVVDAKITKEIQDRTQEDGKLDAKITKEIQDRTQEDGKLDAKITKEIQDRTQEDNIIKLSLNNLRSKTVNGHSIESNPVLNGSDIKLNGYKESQANTVEDLKIKPVDNTTQAFGKLEKRVKLDKEANSSIHNKLKTSVGLTEDMSFPSITDTNYLNDSVNVIDGLKKLDSELKNLGTGNSGSVTELNKKITKEIQDRKEADTNIDNKLTQLINTTKSGLEDKITKEVQDRTQADTSLDTKLTQSIQQETSTRISEDNKVKSEVTAAYKAADKVVDAKITKEIQDRTQEDGKLDAKITETKTALEKSINDNYNEFNTFKGTKGKANGLASLDEQGKVPANQLPSFVDDVIDCYATYDKSPTGEITNVKIYSDATHNNSIVGEPGKIYTDITENQPEYQFRWTGTKYVPLVSGGLIIGEISGTAYDGLKGKETRDSVISLPSTLIVEVPKNVVLETTSIKLTGGKKVTKSGLTYGGQNNSSDIVLPAATTTKAGIMSSADKVKIDTTLPKSILDEANARDAEDKAIRRKIDSDISKEVQDRTQAISDAKREVGQQISNETQARKESEGELESRLDKKITDEKTAREHADSTIQDSVTEETNNRRSEINRVEGLITNLNSSVTTKTDKLTTDLNHHVQGKNNPHGVTKAQVGLDKVDNTSDKAKPVSTAQAAAIADAKSVGTQVKADLGAHTANKNNPHGVTREQLGIGSTSEVVFKKVSAPSGMWKESDKRLKTFIKPLEHTLDDICSIPTSSFLIRGNQDIGTIAQNIEDKFPELVSDISHDINSVPNADEFEKIEKDGETYILVKEVDYSKMSILAIEGIKLLKAELDEIKKHLIL